MNKIGKREKDIMRDLVNRRASQSEIAKFLRLGISGVSLVQYHLKQLGIKTASHPPGRPRVLSDEEIARIRLLYYEEGKSFNEVRKRMGVFKVSGGQIRHWINIKPGEKITRQLYEAMLKRQQITKDHKGD